MHEHTLGRGRSVVYLTRYVDIGVDSVLIVHTFLQTF